MILTMRKIVFLTGTRADFGKLKSLIEITRNQECFEVHIFVTGMHMLQEHG
jgi:UDP-N-acetylglucosamine 2-epimerase (hydrolysing)